MKIIIALITLSFFIACTKNPPTATEKPLPIAGRVAGSIKLYDRYGNESTVYNDVIVKLMNKRNDVTMVTVNTDGKFETDSVLFGDIIVTVSKPGYGYMDSVKFNHGISGDTLTSIDLIEELPFSFYLAAANYSNSYFSFSGSYNYHSAESYMVTEFVCFSKEPEVSINHTNLLWSPSGHTNVQFISGTNGGSSSCAFSTFTDAGFANGDKIYVTVFPGTAKFWTLYYNKVNNYKVLRYKVSNQSRVVSFTLRQ